MIDIPKIRAMCEAATPGPWWRFQGAKCTVRSPDFEGKRMIAIEIKEVNADFIAESRTLIPELCDEIERLQREVALLHSQQRFLQGNPKGEGVSIGSKDPIKVEGSPVSNTIIADRRGGDPNE